MQHALHSAQLVPIVGLGGHFVCVRCHLEPNVFFKSDWLVDKAYIYKEWLYSVNVDKRTCTAFCYNSCCQQFSLPNFIVI